MAPLPLSVMGLSRQLVPVLKKYLSPQGLKTLFTRSSADPGRERYRRAGMTASTSYIAKALTLVMGFVSVPLTVDYLGAERYGVWLTISSLMLWVALTDFGLTGNALVNVLSEAVGNDDRESARHHVASAFWALVTIALVMGVVFMAAFHSIPWRAVFRVSDATSTALPPSFATGPGRPSSRTMPMVSTAATGVVRSAPSAGSRRSVSMRRRTSPAARAARSF